MIRVAIIADSHFSERSRWEECCRIHEWIEGDIASREVDLILHSGDVFDAKSTPNERNKVAEWFQDLANHAPVVAVRGNHDVLGDLEILGKLKSRHPIRVEEGAGLFVVAGCAVLALAWPRKAEVMAKLSAEQASAGGEIAKDALRSVIRGLGAQLATFDGPRIMLAHAMVSGSMTSTGQPLVGCDFELGLDELALSKAHFVALGHIHLGQDWELDGMPIVYPGSPRRTAFGEAEQKGYVIAEFGQYHADTAAEEDTGTRWHCASWEVIETPATPMILAVGKWQLGLNGYMLAFEDAPEVKGAEVRLRYTVDTDQRQAAKAAAEELRAKLLSEGAIVVRVEEIVETTTRARTPEIASAKTLADKMAVLWKARGIELGKRGPAVLAKLNVLEGEL